MTVDRKDRVSNAARIAVFNDKRELAKIDKPVDEKEWGMSPPTVNAYYNPAQNDINFPAGILQPPFFDPGGDAAVNFGAIGMVIGHEMTPRLRRPGGEVRRGWQCAELVDGRGQGEVRRAHRLRGEGIQRL